MDARQMIRRSLAALLPAAALLLLPRPCSAADPYELVQARRLYQEELARAKDQFTRETAEAPQKHLAALLDLEKEFQTDGDLRSLLAVREERRRFTENPSVSGMALVETPRKLRALQAQYVQAHEDRKLALAGAVATLTQTYARHLAALEKELTKKDRIEDAMTVMHEQERLSKDPQLAAATNQLGGAHAQAREPAPAPKTALIGTDQLSKVLRAEIIGWNPRTGEITLRYDFAAKDQVADWEGGTYYEGARLLCNGAPAWFKVPFVSVTSVKFDGYISSGEGAGEGGLKLRFGKGQGLTAEIGAGANREKMVLYQANEYSPVTSADRPAKPDLKYHSELALDAESVLWSVNGQNLNRGRLQMPVPAPFRLGLGDEGNRTTYDNVTVSGALSLEHLRAML